MTEKVAACVIGLGNIGGAVAARLVDEGVAVTGYDPSPEPARRAGEAGVQVATSVAEAVKGADVILTSLPLPEHVRSVCLDEGGVVASARPGATLVELSTIDPRTMSDVAASATAAGLHVLDAPVTGGPPQALAGQLTFLVGASEEDLDVAAPLLAHLGTPKRVGDIGAGKTVKLVNNMMSMANVLAAAEAFSLGVHAGMDPEVLFDILSQSGGRSWQFTETFPRVVGRDFEARFSMAMARKDLRLAQQFAQDVGMPAPFSNEALSLYSEAADEGFDDLDCTGVVLLFEKWLSNRAK